MTGGQSAVRMNDLHSFPVSGLVELSRARYRGTPLAVVEIAFKHGFESPEFQAQLKQYPPGTEVSAFMFQRVVVPGMCLGEPVASD
jgi:hypothetical protein